MIKSYAGTIAAGIITLVITVFILCPYWVAPNIGGIHGQEITVSEWMDLFSTRCIWTIILATLSVLVWIYLSAEKYPLNLGGTGSQMPYWILHALPPLLVGIASYMMLPSIADGGSIALIVILLPAMLCFWVASLLFSPHKSSVLLGDLHR